MTAVVGVIAYGQTGYWFWLTGTLIIFANWPYILIFLVPTHNNCCPFPWIPLDQRLVGRLRRGDEVTWSVDISARWQLSHFSWAPSLERQDPPHIIASKPLTCAV